MTYDKKIRGIKIGDNQAIMQMIKELDEAGELTKARMTRLMMMGAPGLQDMWDSYIRDRRELR